MKIIISGQGGQGIQFLALLFAKTMISKGKYVTLNKSYGPEARSGFSKSSIIISDKPITNPIVSKADYLIAFSKEAVNMWGPYSKNIIYHDNEDNMIMLGIFTKTINENIESVIETMKKEISVKYIDRLNKNIENLNKGYNSI